LKKIRLKHHGMDSDMMKAIPLSTAEKRTGVWARTGCCLDMRYVEKAHTEPYYCKSEVLVVIIGFVQFNYILFLYGAAAHIGPWPPLYEVP
jgi:hypothetical protein